MNTIGTDGTLRDEPVLKNISLALVAGYAWRVEGVDLSFGLAWTEHELEGLQLGNAALDEGDLRGLQASGFVSVVGGTLHGAQLSGTWGWVEGDVHGFQGSGLVDVARGRVHGFQGAGLATWARREVHGFQSAGLFNYAGEELHGFQAAGVANIAGDVRGLQIAPLNIGDRASTQIGIVNVAERADGVTIGLVNAIRDGIHGVSVYASDTAATNVAFTLGGKHTYTAFTAGIAPFVHSKGWVAGIGFGGRATLGDFYADLSEFARIVRTDFADGFAKDTGELFTTQLIAGWEVFEPVKIFAGPTFNVYHTHRAREDDPFIPARATHSSSPNAYDWPGFVAGLEL
jgi:hypothetical protein